METHRIEEWVKIKEFYWETNKEALVEWIYEVLWNLKFKYLEEAFLEKVVNELLYTITKDSHTETTESEIIVAYLHRNYPYNI